MSINIVNLTRATIYSVVACLSIFIIMVFVVPTTYAKDYKVNIAMLEIKIDTPASQDVDNEIQALLQEYNKSQIGPHTRVPFTIYAKDQNKIIAGIIGTCRTDYDCFIDTYVVDKAYRRQGIGGRMLTELEKLARAQHCKHILVETAAFQNSEFYSKHGFKKLATIKEAFLGHDFYILKKEL